MKRQVLVGLSAGLLVAWLCAPAPGSVYVSAFGPTTTGPVYEGDTVGLEVYIGPSFPLLVGVSGTLEADTAPADTQPIPSSQGFGSWHAIQYFTYRDNGVAQASVSGSGTEQYMEWVPGFPSGHWEGRTQSNSFSASTEFNVLNRDPRILGVTSSLTRLENEPFSFEAMATDPGVNDVLVFSWDMDSDGQYDDYSGPTGQTSLAHAGLYTFRVQVSDGDGGYAYGAFGVTINAAPVPEPGSVVVWSLFGVCGSILALWRIARGRNESMP